jgi:putative FmdB family regulatory protein
MPTYEYACPKCGEFEITQRITEDSLKKCPTCKSKVRKLMSSTSFQLKGSGWYVTDYASKKGEPKDGAKESGTAAGDDSAKSSGTESKPSPSTESKPSPSTESKPSPASESTPKDTSTTSKKDTSAKAA